MRHVAFMTVGENIALRRKMNTLKCPNLNAFQTLHVRGVALTPPIP